MPRAILTTLTLSVLLTAGGCEYNLTPSATDAEGNLDRLVQMAEAVYSTSYTEAESKAVRKKADVLDTFQRAVMRYRDDEGAERKVSLAALDRRARSLIQQHRRDGIAGQFLIQGISQIMSMVLQGAPAERNIPVDTRMNALRYYLELVVQNQGSQFESQIRALRVLSEHDPQGAERIARQALANQRAFKRTLRRPPTIPAWIREQASAKQLQELRQRNERSRQGRLQRFDDMQVGRQLATLAGQM